MGEDQQEPKSGWGRVWSMTERSVTTVEESYRRQGESKVGEGHIHLTWACLGSFPVYEHLSWLYVPFHMGSVASQCTLSTYSREHTFIRAEKCR